MAANLYQCICTSIQKATRNDPKRPKQLWNVLKDKFTEKSQNHRISLKIRRPNLWTKMLPNKIIFDVAYFAKKSWYFFAILHPQWKPTLLVYIFNIETSILITEKKYEERNWLVVARTSYILGIPWTLEYRLDVVGQLPIGTTFWASTRMESKWTRLSTCIGDPAWRNWLMIGWAPGKTLRICDLFHLHEAFMSRNKSYQITFFRIVHSIRFLCAVGTG